MAKKYYAVKAGRKTGVFESWDECKSAVSGFSGAAYKSFTNREDAIDFVNGSAKSQKAQNREEKQSEAFAYVDGSYDDTTKSYSYGMVMMHGEDELHFFKKFEKDDMSDMRNVAGEIEGSMAAMKYCIENGIKSISIFYDYEGIQKWCNGDWKAKKEGTKRYVEFYKDASKLVDVDFIKVKGHSGDKYNDLADELAKKALGLI
ncbi:ribonuclease HI [Lachnoanaerobaculum saburreum F0468]|uniref:Ribonuclease H n=1 Tax=Lachnoanaerobaculum saburreum F0468 TaxID=1095750 RepID=I0RAE7_9FIRM|nr:ribonuclease H family protein [Lachnoanaerobaculum saburreum]EIC96655.1 ribonuclease HI [Lachnoanaerobaculum saburreum F0468]